jgi:hypothetical protein
MFDNLHGRAMTIRHDICLPWHREKLKLLAEKSGDLVVASLSCADQRKNDYANVINKTLERIIPFRYTSYTLMG